MNNSWKEVEVRKSCEFSLVFSARKPIVTPSVYNKHSPNLPIMHPRLPAPNPDILELEFL